MKYLDRFNESTLFPFDNNIKTVRLISNIAEDEGFNINIKTSTRDNNWTPKPCTHLLQISSNEKGDVRTLIEMFQNISDRLKNEGFLVIAQISYDREAMGSRSRFRTIDINEGYPFIFIIREATLIRSVTYYLDLK